MSTGQGFSGYNMYAYCGNYPVNLVDNTGTMPKFTAEFAEKIKDVVETAIGPLLYVTELNKKGKLLEFWIERSGKVRWSRHHTNHGNSKDHPVVPHDHEWYDDDDGNNTQNPQWEQPNPGFQAPNSNNNNNNDKNTTKAVVDVIGSVAIGYVIYAGTKWLIAGLFAPVTGGGSLVVAGVTP